MLRQYKSVRKSRNRETFSYRDIKDVYTIVFFEKSTKEFHKYPDVYIHYFQQTSDSGLQMELLQKYVFIPLDIFGKSHQNKSIQDRLEAWLTFLGSDDPQDIISVIERYPDFKAMYEQIYEICQNVERVMGMFSKELRQMDRNTVRYMIDEMQNEIDKQREELSRKDEELDRKDEELDRNKELLAEKDRSLQEALKRIEELERQQKTAACTQGSEDSETRQDSNAATQD